jgi:glycosyltransferase involved in cell wall biosynthesis
MATHIAWVKRHDVGRAPRVCMHVIGIARTDERVKREATALRDAGVAVTIVDVESDATRARDEDLSGIHLRHVIMPSRYAQTRFKPWFLFKTARLIFRAALELARQPADAYHAHDDNALPAVFLAARLRRKPLVFDAHELPLSEPSVTRWRTLHRFAVRTLRHMVRHSAGVITVSPPIARQIQATYGGPPATLVRNVPVFHDSLANSCEIHTHLGLSPQTRVSLYQGLLQKNRALDVLVRAAKDLDPGNVIVLMGTGPSRTDLETLIAQEGVGERVRILSAVPYDQLLRWTASADLGLILYRADHSLNVRYCLPNKLFEYLMAGVPILASMLDAVADVVTTYDVGRIVESLQPPAVAAAINQMLADREQLDRMRANCLAASRERFRWDVEQQGLIELYAHVLRRPTGTSSNTRGAGLFIALLLIPIGAVGGAIVAGVLCRAARWLARGAAATGVLAVQAKSPLLDA